MATAASGKIAEPMVALRTMLGACDAFQTWVGASTAAQAQARVRFGKVDIEHDSSDIPLVDLQLKRPYALIDLTSFSIDCSGHAPCAGGSMLVRMAEDIPDEIKSDTFESEVRLWNAVGTIWWQFAILTYSATSGYLRGCMIELEAPRTRYTRGRAHKQGDVQWVDLAVSWVA